MFVAFGNFITNQVGNPGNHESLSERDYYPNSVICGLNKFDSY